MAGGIAPAAELRHSKAQEISGLDGKAEPTTSVTGTDHSANQPALHLFVRFGNHQDLVGGDLLEALYDPARPLDFH